MNLWNKIVSFIQSKQPNQQWLKLLLVLVCLILAVLYKRRYMPSQHTEGFSQNEKYVVKREDDVYDAFYVGIYDHLYKTDARCQYEKSRIVESTQPDPQNSVFLDVGCGTGCMVDTLRSAGYRAFGIDKSDAMVHASRQKYPRAQVQKANGEDSMAFDRETFTHILCLQFTVYEFPDKIAFFRNCYHWLVPGGYFIVHLVNPTTFDPIIPAGKPRLLSSPQKYATERITDTVIDFADFKYKSSFDFRKVDERGEVRHVETFTDKETHHIRENERTLRFDRESEVIDQILFCRFTLEGQFSMEDYNSDMHQNIYLFKKI